MKILSIILSTLILVACGGGDETPVAIINTSVPHPVANAATVSGGSAVAVHMYQALYGMAPSNATLSAHTVQATSDPSAFARNLAGNFLGRSHTALAKLVLDNLGVTAATVTAVNAQGQSEYAILLDALGQMFTFYGADARGQIILNATNLLAGLESDATYGVTAVSYNNQATANYSYSSNSANTGAAVISTATANAGAAQSVAVGAVVTLDGSASRADVGRTLTYGWTLTTRPAGSSANLSSATAAKPTFTADVAGTFVASLIVSDGRVNSTAATASITAVAHTLTLISVSDSFFGSADTAVAMPFSTVSSASASVQCVGSGCATVYDLDTFRLRASGQSYTIANLAATNLTAGSSVMPLFSGLSNGQTITDGSTVTFKLQSPFTQGSTINLRYTFTVQETGATFGYTVQLRTN
jgi:hypothetical protein